MAKTLRPAALERLHYLLLRDFCESVSQISNQFHRFRLTADIGWPILDSLLGRQRNRGPLWQMKDTAHHLSLHYASCASEPHPAAFLDLTLGAVFHETIRLKEIAYLGAIYLPAAREALGLPRRPDAACPARQQPEQRSNSAAATPERPDVVGNPFSRTRRPEILNTGASGLPAPARLEIESGPFLEQGRQAGERLLPLLESAFSALPRIMTSLECLVREARMLMCLVYHGKNANIMVARMVANRAVQVERAFADRYPLFLNALAGNLPFTKLQAEETRA